MILIITEKPSVALEIAKLVGANLKRDGYYEGNGYIVSWCYGHLIGLARTESYDSKYEKWDLSDLPIIPASFRYAPDNDKSKRKQLAVIKSQIIRKDVDYIVNAADAGREGELIFRHVYNYCSTGKRVKRLWVSSLEEKAVRDGLDNLIDGEEFDPLYKAAEAREQADWLVGINFTRLFSLLYGPKTINVGRVMTPALCMVAERDKEIAAFVKTPFYTPYIVCGGFKAYGQREDTKEKCNEIASACNGKTAVVETIDKKVKRVKAPKLYDLTSLQREANKKYGYTAQETLNIAQELYEKKLTTYPRTDSRHITADMKDKIAAMLAGTGFGTDINKLVGPVSDHHAILPTQNATAKAAGSLGEKQGKIFSLIKSRVLEAAAPDYVYESAKAVLRCGDYKFEAKGNTAIEEGWRQVRGITEKEDEENGPLPALAQGQSFENVTSGIKEGETKPPERFTEDTLLAAMERAGAKETADDVERKGIGTPATRAGIIEKLVKCGFIKREKKAITATQTGIQVIDVMPEKIKSPSLTSEWENLLKEVEKGNCDAGSFMREIREYVMETIEENKMPDETKKPIFIYENKESAVPAGICPRCGKNVTEGSKGFFCEDKNCNFKIWHDNKFWASKKRKLTRDELAAMLTGKAVEMKGLYSERTGKKYDAKVSLNDDGGKYVGFKVDFN